MLQLQPGLQDLQRSCQILAFEFMVPQSSGALGQATPLLSQSSPVPPSPATALSVLCTKYQIKAGILLLSNHPSWLWSGMLPAE